MQGYRPHRTIGRALGRFHWLVWGIALLAGTLAFGATFTRHRTYEATATLTLYEANNTSQGFDLALQADQYLSQRFIALATSRPVLEQVCAAQWGSCDPVALSKRIQATTPRATGQISITASASSPAGAATLADDVANELVRRNRAEVAAAVSPERTYLQQQLASIDGSINATQEQIRQIQNTPRTDAWVSNGLAPLLSRLNLLQGQYANTYTKLQDLDAVAAQRSATLSVYQPASVPSKPADPDPVRYVGVGVVGGLIAGFVLALLAERFRDRIGDGAELAEAAGCSIVLDLRGRADPSAVGPYGFLTRASLQARQTDARTILLVAASAADRLDRVAETLAMAAAQVHHRVLIIPSSGLGEELERREIQAGHGSAVIVTRPEVIGRNGYASWQDDRFDLTIHCALPPMADPSMRWAKPAACSAILVATQRSTRFSDARRTAEQLRLVGVETAAAILLPRRWRKSWNSRGGVDEPAKSTDEAAGADSLTAGDVAVES
jgi:capsular polysaccharide biosynthesis protein